MCFLVVQVTNSSFMSLSAVLIFGATNFHSRPLWYEKLTPESEVDLRRPFLERV